MADINAKFSTQVTRYPGDYVAHYIPVDDATALKFPLHGRTRRVLCSINGNEAFPCALMPVRAGDFSIGVSKVLMNRFELKVDETVSVEIVADTSKYGMPMPEEFHEVLAQDSDGERLFHGLTIGKQRSMLYMIGQVSDIDRRIHIGLILLEHLKKNDGKVIDKLFQQEIKRPLF